MPTPLYYPPTQNGLQKTLDAELLTGVTAAATLNNVTGIQNKKGIMVIDRVDSNNNLTPSKREYISFDGTSGSTVVTLARGLAGSTDQDHAVGAVVEFVNDVVQQQAILDGLLLTVTTAGALNKATGATINTGTADDTIVTPKAIADSTIMKLSDGWILSTDTWTYASATTFTIAGVDRTAMFPKGTKIKLTQTTAKYFYVVGSAFSTNTTITVAGGTSYTVANETITSPYYSYASSPQGFPSVFAYTPTVTSGTGAITSYTVSAVFSLIGKIAFVNILLTLTNAGTAGLDIRITLPITAVGAGGYAAGTGFPEATYGSLGVGALSPTSLLFRNYDGSFIGTTGGKYVITYTYNI